MASWYGTFKNFLHKFIYSNCCSASLVIPVDQVLGEISEVVKTGVWVGDCFIFTSSLNRLNYYVGGEIVTIAHLDRCNLRKCHYHKQEIDLCLTRMPLGPLHASIWLY